MAQIPSADRAGEPIAGAAGRDRVFRWPLTVFLVAVVGVLAYGGYARFRTPSVDAAVRWLADGDLDARERQRALVAVVAGARASAAPEVRLAGALAAIGLGDRDGYDALCASLGGGPVPSVLPPQAARELLHLGDPMLGNCLRAFAAEAAGDRAAAAVAWRQVKAQAALSDQPFARDLAEAGLRRAQ